ncbi:MAG TPA: cation-translocating P-type ATPase [Longimicrobiales bacterium]
MTGAPDPIETAAPWHALSVDEALDRLESAPSGLGVREARARLRRFGPNALETAPPASAWRILLDQLRSVVVLLLAVAAAVAWAVGDPLDAAAIGGVVVINTGLGFLTEIRARRAMEALLRLEVAHATVVREGRAQQIDARDLVPGDVIRVEAGDAVPADARLLTSVELRVNEAALTGESVPADKQAAAVLDVAVPLADRRNMLYKSTTVGAGSATAVVVATGMATEVGRIGRLVGGIAEERTPLEVRLDALGRRLVGVALVLGALVAALGAVQGMPLGRLIETGIALAIAAVPEGLPVVATVTLAVGVRRMAARHALVRRLPSVETLGSVTRICTDKTGTLTAGEMTVTTVWVADREFRISGVGYAPDGVFSEDGVTVRPATVPALELALRIGALANRADVARTGAGWTVRGDPTEAALLVAARKAGLDREALRAALPETGEVPFSSERQLMATFHRAADGGTVAYVKGAPARIVALCERRIEPGGEERPLDTGDREALLARNRKLAAQGLRVLALACGRVREPRGAALRGLTFVGFVGMIDPPAPGVAETIRVFRAAGIRTIMLTGDQQLTAEAIARELGVLAPGEEVLDGSEFERLSDPELAARVQRVGAFSRVGPEAKLRIVSAYQRDGEIVAMLGDGVNDAAALKKADVGVAMGRRGTDVAKEAADVVLRDDRFRTIGAAVEEGRVIFDNIRKFVFYLFSCNLAEVLVLLGAGAAGLPLPLTPLQILWLNLVTDTFPALALALEPAEPDLMRRPPRDPQKAILSAGFARAVLFYAVLIAGASLGAFLWGLAATDPFRAITIGFMTLALAQASHLGNARSPGHVIGLRRATSNPYALGAVVLVVLLQLLAVGFAPLAQVLDVVPLRAREWLIITAFALLPAIVGQGLKLGVAFNRRRAHPSDAQ